ncbi:PREDICTED: zinc finger protein ZAT3-like [Nicotiana attenuata]|uniref:Zinc finger protein zat3 n=1 Tax=Nicotiana attenuata TaxID=49451 RepID=A0A1J6IC03_NICAT|nr:PREDICTED: zinc finger protein ZAT3-like [Nicotiana attenuata]OIT02462.1 zinc finger protein zat3 [Nicotiana attenuata]OIT18621.1 zinc finger protein zat3 [Nicotiana attenuata]
MEHHASTSSNSYQSLAFSSNFLLDHRQPQIEDENPSTLPMFDSTTNVPSDHNLHTSVSYQPHNNPKRKRSRFLRIGNSFPITKSSSSSGVIKPKCTKKPPDPSAPKITRPCTECGKKFLSLKALFGHMRCHPERQWRGINPPPNFRRHNDDSSTSAPEFSPRQNKVSSQTPKSLSHMIMTDKDHDIASCLLLLANGGSKPDDNDEPENVVRDRIIVDASAEPSASSSGVGEAKCCRFECSSCKKVFGSHQALGGHRASHKNVKGCFASTSGSGLTQAPLILNPNAHDHITTNLDLNFPPPVTLISGEDQYDSSSSYSSTYSGSALDLRLRL